MVHVKWSIFLSLKRNFLERAEIMFKHVFEGLIMVICDEQYWRQFTRTMDESSSVFIITRKSFNSCFLQHIKNCNL